MALNLKRLSYEYLEQDLKNKSELLLISNPIHKKVPIFIHNNQTVCESLVILQYIDEVWPEVGPTILPSDPYERAIARFWAAFVDDKLYASWSAIFKAKSEEAKAEAISQTVACLILLEEAFKNCSKGKIFFNGDSVGFLDFTLGSHSGWIKTAEEMFGIKLYDERKMPLLLEWQNRFRLVDCVNEVIPDAVRIEEYLKSMGVGR
ncbi:hypothetical protein LUZ60_014650 [Juncus effusus]|nr:hypothetical protein LUZ60_014650 [Juncus effusus]